MERLEDALDQRGIQKHAQKDFTGELSGAGVGVHLVHGRYLSPNAPRLLLLLRGVMELLEGGSASPQETRALMEHLQWLDLLNRFKLAAYEEIYGFGVNSGLGFRQPLTEAIFDELLLSALHAVFWTADLHHPYLPLITASDAPTSFGFGAAAARLPVKG